MTDALPAALLDLDEYTESINMMVYGDSGVGKTVFASTDDKVLIIATENGTVSAARHIRKKGLAGKGLRKVWDCVNDWDAFVEAYEWCEAQCEAGTMPFDWVVIDTATELQRVAMLGLVAERHAKKPSSSVDVFELQEYGESQNRLMRYIGLFNDLSVNVLYLAHVMEGEDEDANTYVLPKFHGKGDQIARWVMAAMHSYGYMHMVEVLNSQGKAVQSRRIEWAASQSWRAKDRYDCLAPRTAGKTLKQIRQLIEATDEPAEPPKAPAKKTPASA